MPFIRPVRLFSTVILTSSCLLPSTPALAYKYIHPQEFSIDHSARILTQLGANDTLLQMNRLVSDQMGTILESPMVQGMATGTLTRDEWEKNYMRADVLYIYKLGQELAERAKNETDPDRSNMMALAEMFLGYGKHFERLQKYGLSPDDQLDSQECDAHIALLSRETSIDEFYVAILTDMIPYVVFANYLLHSIDPTDNNPWIDYARKYGDLDSKYAKERLGKTIQTVNGILSDKKIPDSTAEKLFLRGFSFEEWFIRHSFSDGFTIIPS